MKRSLWPAAALIIALSGCGGGASGGSAAPTTPTGPIGSGTGLQYDTALFKIAIPQAPASPSASGPRVPQYISSSTKSITITVNTVNGSAPSPAIPATTANLTTGSPNCALSGGVLNCTISAPAPIGTDNFTLTMFDNTGGTGLQLSTSTITATIAKGVANNVSVTLGGVVHSIALSLATANPAASGSPQNITLNVTAKDADGNTILGSDPYAAAIAVTDSNANTAQSALSLDGGTTKSASVSVTNPNAAVTVAYSGTANICSDSFSASASGVNAANITGATLTPARNTISASGTVDLLGLPASSTLTPSEANYSGTFSATSNGTAIATVSASAPFTLSAVSAGQTTVTFSDACGGSSNVAVSVTTTGFTVH